MLKVLIAVYIIYIYIYIYIIYDFITKENWGIIHCVSEETLTLRSQQTHAKTCALLLGGHMTNENNLF